MSVCSIFFLLKKDIPGARGCRRAILNSPESHNLVFVRDGARTGNQQFGQARPVDERRRHRPQSGAHLVMGAN